MYWGITLSTSLELKFSYPRIGPSLLISALVVNYKRFGIAQSQGYLPLKEFTEILRTFIPDQQKWTIKRAVLGGTQIIFSLRGKVVFGSEETAPKHPVDLELYQDRWANFFWKVGVDGNVPVTKLFGLPDPVNFIQEYLLTQETKEEEEEGNAKENNLLSSLVKRQEIWINQKNCKLQKKKEEEKTSFSKKKPLSENHFLKNI